MFESENLIDLVKEHECLWKYSSPQYHDKTEKRKAYTAVAEVLFDDWETLPEEIKRDRLLMLDKKWRNIRDCFRKELRREKYGSGRKRRYIYVHKLGFLRSQMEDKLNDVTFGDEPMDQKQNDLISKIKVDNSNESHDELFEYEYSSFDAKPGRDSTVSDERTNTPVFPSILTTPRRTTEESKLVSFLEHWTVQQQDQDMAFFQSIISSVHKLNDIQRMEFRLDVLNALKKFQDPLL